jgi:steroid delta-isomerase-like uncharacterized protein
MTQENKTLARRVFEEVWSRSEWSLIDEIYADDYVAHVTGAPKPIEGIDQFRQFVGFHAVLSPDLSFTVEDQVAEGSKVATRWTARGSHATGLLGTEATGQTVVVSGMTLHRFENGKIVESWDNWDAMAVLQALGPDVFESIALSI